MLCQELSGLVIFNLKLFCKAGCTFVQTLYYQAHARPSHGCFGKVIDN